jgi:hypothetical protein
MALADACDRWGLLCLNRYCSKLARYPLSNCIEQSNEAKSLEWLAQLIRRIGNTSR